MSAWTRAKKNCISGSFQPRIHGQAVDHPLRSSKNPEAHVEVAGGEFLRRRRLDHSRGSGFSAGRSYGASRFDNIGRGVKQGRFRRPQLSNT
jgi:hypothetical protein